MFNRILVVVAHPDDDILGCGGTLAKYSSSCSIRVVFIAEGTSCRFEKGEKSRVQDEISVRSDYAKRALKKLDIYDIHLHDLPCGNLNVIPRIEINKIIESHIKEFSPDTLITHSANDANLDHRIVFESALVATRPGATNYVSTLLSCEILSSSEWAFNETFKPNLFIPISLEELDLKVSALNEYSSEIRDYPFPRSERGLLTQAQFRGMQSGTEFAESFQLIRQIGAPN